MNTRKMIASAAILLATALIIKYLYDDAQRANATLSIPIAQPFEVKLKGEPSVGGSGFTWISIAWHGKTIGRDGKEGPEADHETRTLFNAAFPRKDQPMHRKSMLAFQRLIEGKNLRAICLKPKKEYSKDDITCDLLVDDDISVTATLYRNGYAIPHKNINHYMSNLAPVYNEPWKLARAEKRGQWGLKSLHVPWDKTPQDCPNGSLLGGLFGSCDTDQSPPGELILVSIKDALRNTGKIGAANQQQKSGKAEQQPADKSSGDDAGKPSGNLVGKAIDKVVDKAGEKVAEKVVERITDDLKEDILDSVLKKVVR